MCVGVLFDITGSFQPKICNGCHDMTQKSMNFHDAVTVTLKGNDYRIKFRFMTKREAVDRMKNSHLSVKRRLLSLSINTYYRNTYYRNNTPETMTEKQSYGEEI